MSSEHDSLSLPAYDEFAQAIAPLGLQLSVSGLHGLLCGYLCSGAASQGESYIRALLENKKGAASKEALVALFALFSVSQQQMSTYDLAFSLMLPDDEAPLHERAQAFSEWCAGFTQGLSLAGVVADDFEEEEAQDAFQHMVEFAELDYEHLDVDEEDEHALMEVVEYARMAVIRLHGDIMLNKRKGQNSSTSH